MSESMNKDREALEVLEHHMPQDARPRIRTKEASVNQDAGSELPAVRTKPAKNIKRKPREGAPASQSSCMSPTEGKTSSGVGMTGIKPAAAALTQATSIITQAAATEQVGSRPEPVKISPRTRQAIQQATATVIRQGAHIARQSATGAASAVIGRAASSQRVSRRNNPRVKSASAPKLMKRTVVQAGRGVKYVVNKSAEQFSEDPSKSKRNPDSAVSDLAMRQAQALAGKVVQLATRKAAQAAGRVAARLAMKVAQLLAQAAGKAISALLATTGPVGVVIVVVLFAAILAAVLLSPMGIFAGGGGNGTPTISAMVSQLNGELADKIERLKKDAKADKVTVSFNGSDIYSSVTNWPDILGVFAVKVGLDPEQPSDVVVLDAAKQDILRSTFWGMVSVSSSMELVDAPASTAPDTSPVATSTPVSTRGPIEFRAPAALGAIVAGNAFAGLEGQDTPAAQPSPTPAPKRKIQAIHVECLDWEDAQKVYTLSADQVSVLQSLMSAKPYSMLAQLAGAATGEAATDWAGIIDVPEGGMPIPLYLQGQYTEPVCYIDGEPRSVRSSGCGAASSSMVIAYLAGNTSQTPYTLFKWAYDNGYYSGDGLSHSCLTKLLALYGIKGTWTANNTEKITEALKAGHPVIAHMGPGIFTDQGHYIVLRGITDDGHVLVNDPGNRKRNLYAYLLRTVVAQARTSSSFMICAN